MTPPTRDNTHSLTLANGKVIPDPYHVLENPEHPETKQYAQDCHDEFVEYITTDSDRDALLVEMTQLVDFPSTGLPALRGNHYYISHNRGLENQSTIYRIPIEEMNQTEEEFVPEKAELFADPNTFSSDGTTALRTTAFTADGSYWAYGTSDKGSDWMSIRVKDVNTKKDTTDLIQWAKFTGITWYLNEGFYYSGYGMKEMNVSAGTETEKQTHHRIFYHQLGTSQDQDICVYRAHGDVNQDLMHGAIITDDNQWIFASISRGCESVVLLATSSLSLQKNNLVYKKAKDGFNNEVQWTNLFNEWDAEYSVVYNKDSHLLIRTNLDAKNYRLIEIDLDDPSKLVEVLPENKHQKLDDITVVNYLLLIEYIVDASNSLSIWKWNYGKCDLKMMKLQDVVFPNAPFYSLQGVRGKHNHEQAYVSITNYTMPSTQYRIDLDKTNYPVTKIRSTKLSSTAPELEAFETKQLKFESKDGTIVPMFITAMKTNDITPRPLLMYGYGGFGIDLMPSFSATRLSLLSKGAIFVVVNLRGGGEYGDEWHDAGRREKKQNVFDDFIGAGEELIRLGLTTSDLLVIQGGSNGGLLVTACANQRPDLFKAAIAQVPVTDMTRFHKFTIGHAWIPEYGNPDQETDVAFMLKYSPLHTIPNQGIYPAMLVMTADHDDRVVPLHSFKFHAELRHKLGSVEGQNPLLLRVDLNAGHGAGKPKSKVIEEVSDLYAFFFKVTSK